MYLPWLRYLFASHTISADGGGMEFPGAIFLIVFGLAYLTAAIALPIRLYRRREVSRAHTIAFYASLGILALFTTLIWRAI